MNDEARIWLEYAEENLATSRLAAENDYKNASLQNSQQAAEKALKSLIIANGLKFRRTHSISEICKLIKEQGISIDICDEDCDLLDVIYIPSKYPVMSVLPDMMPDHEIVEKCFNIAKKIVMIAKNNMSRST